MSTHSATVVWQRGSQPFFDNRYSRAHRWRFDGNIEVVASSSPSVVRVPMSLEEAVDPEEAFVAALSSCHMLFFLSLAARARLIVDEYFDAAEGVMESIEGRMRMARVLLRPRVTFGGDIAPSDDRVRELHHRAHEACYLANSVRFPVDCEPIL